MYPLIFIPKDFLRGGHLSDFFWIMKMCSVFGLEKMTKNYRRTRNKSRADACGYVTEIQISFKAALSQKIGWTAINAKMDAFRQKIDTQRPPIGFPNHFATYLFPFSILLGSWDFRSGLLKK